MALLGLSNEGVSTGASAMSSVEASFALTAVISILLVIGIVYLFIQLVLLLGEKKKYYEKLNMAQKTDKMPGGTE